MRFKPITFVLSLLLIAPGVGFGAGFHNPDVDTVSIGFAGANIARVDRAVATYMNPAKLPFIEGKYFSVQASLNLGWLNWKFDGQYPYGDHAGEGFTSETPSDPNFLPSLFVSSSLGIENFGMGVGFCAPFGMAVEWPEEGGQRYLLQETEFAPPHYIMSFGYKFSDKLSIGFGGSFIDAYLLDKRVFRFGVALTPSAPPIYVDVNGEFTGYDTSFSNIFALFINPIDRFAIGVTYYSEADIELRGHLKVWGEMPLIGEIERSLKARVNSPIPQVLKVGALTKLLKNKNLSIEVAAYMTDWSIYKQNLVHVEPLPVDDSMNPFDKLLNEEINKSLGAGVIIKRHWKDNISTRIGIEYAFAFGLALRVGALYEPSAIPRYTLNLAPPDDHKTFITLGAGYKWKTLAFDFGWSHLFTREGEVQHSIHESDFSPAANGKHEVTLDALSFSVTYSL